MVLTPTPSNTKVKEGAEGYTSSSTLCPLAGYIMKFKRVKTHILLGFCMDEGTTN